MYGFLAFIILIGVIVFLVKITKSEDNATPQRSAKSNIQPMQLTQLEVSDFDYRDATYCIIDTETSGLPTYRGACSSDFGANPYVLSIAWIVLDHNLKVIYRENHYLLQKESIYISPEASAKNGITKELMLSKGEDIVEVLSKLENQTRAVSFFVGHNISFDQPIIECECLRHKIYNPFDGKRSFCTMKNTTALFDSGKWPKLVELAKALFGASVTNYNYHDAMADTEMTALCFRELVRRGFVQPVEKKQKDEVDYSSMLNDEEIVDKTTIFYHKQVAIVGLIGGMKKKETYELLHRLGAILGASLWHSDIIVASNKPTEKQAESIVEFAKKVISENETLSILESSGLLRKQQSA